MVEERQVLVTGGAGCVGLPVIRTLMDRGHRVRSFDLQAPDAELCAQWRISPRAVEWCAGDLRNRDEIQRVLAGCDGVIHAAALDLPTSAERPEDAVEINGLATRALVEVAADRGVRSFVLISSAAASCQPPSVYGTLKLLAERTLAETAARSGMLGHVVRPFVVFGPGRSRGISAGLSQACAEAARRLPTEIPFSGLSWFDPLDRLAETVVEALDSACHLPSPIMPGLAGDVRAIARLLSRLSGQPVSVRGEPMPAFRFVNMRMVARDAAALDRALTRIVARFRGRQMPVDMG